MLGILASASACGLYSRVRGQNFLFTFLFLSIVVVSIAIPLQLRMETFPAESVHNQDASDAKPSFFNNVSNKASAYHAGIPYLSKLPFPAIVIIVTLIVVNLIVWAVVGVVLVRPLRLRILPSEAYICASISTRR